MTTGTSNSSDNGISGEMLLEFCEEDIHDAFSIFKDRFIVRKTIREHKQKLLNKPTGLQHQQLFQENASTLTQGDNPVKLATNKTIAPSASQSTSPPSASQSTSPFHSTHTSVAYPRVPTIHHLHYPQQHSRHNQSIKEPFQLLRSHEIKVENVSKPGYSCSNSGSLPSSHMDVQPFPSPVKSPLMHHVVSSSVEERVSRPETVIVPTGEPIMNISQNQVVRSLNIITVEEKQRIRRFSADALLEKKCIRSKPNEAQHLGSLAIRNAAQVAQIWDNPPVLREISGEKKEQFVKSLLSFAPQLADRMDMVWIRLREALQNRRKYLSDKETGKRQTKTQRPSPYEKRTPNSPILLKVTEAGPMIDLTDIK